MDETVANDVLKTLDGPIPSKPVAEDVSIVIPTLGRPILESCLRSIADGSLWPGRLIVVDQGQNKTVAGWLGHLSAVGLGTHYIPSGQHGRAAGLNRGLEQVTTRFVTITDDDCLVAADWLEK
jgi:glycosyltransferase involved in cell wall biosynthesis